MNVTFRSEVIAVADRRVTFKVEAYDERDKIAEGTHERGIVNVAKFATRVAAKAETAGRS
jgi:fluoroacetyl-CoA thioesterase